jgi:small subunit ribosomal protein S1
MSEETKTTTPEAVEDTSHADIAPVAPPVEDLPPKEAQAVVDAESEGMPPPEVAIETQIVTEAAEVAAEAEAAAPPVTAAEPVAAEPTDPADDPALEAGAVETDPVLEAEAANAEATPALSAEPSSSDDAPTASADEPDAEAERSEPLATPASMDELAVGMEVAGMVKRIALFGAFVDIGVGKDALLHISQLGNPDVRNVEDVVAVGQALNVFILKVDREQGRIAVSMVKPIGVPWEQLRIGAQVTGNIIKVESYGVFLEFGAERPGMIHVSELADGYVKSPSDVVQMGQEVTAQIIKLDRKKKRIDLSVKALSQQEEKQAAKFAREEQQEEYVPTAMELALRSAMKSDDEFKRGSSKRDRRDDRRERRERDREDFFERTIRGHRN